jgi:hypothetical protein
MAEWTLLRDKNVIEDDTIDITTTDSANPFGDFLIARIDDAQGTNFDEYEFGTRVDAQIQNNNQINDTIFPWEFPAEFGDSGGAIDDFTGFVVERRETDQRGADTLEVEAYTFDQFLRRNDVSNDQSGNTISTALENIIKNDTPVTFNSNLVNVGDDSELTLSLQDEKVETALQILAFKSENEAFGVNSNFEFFFRERETKHIDRGISNTQWFNYDLPERGKEAVNEVEVRYNNGNDRVVVDNPGQKLDLQDNLNLPEPGTQRVRINRPEITDAKDAEDEGRRFLKFRNATLSGTVSTYGLYDAEPFDTINVEIIDRGIDSEFIITKVEKNWARDETTLTLVENRGFEEDFIVRLTEKTERIDLRDSNADAAVDRITTTNVGLNVSVTGDVGGTTTDASKVVNDGLNQLRDGWVGDGGISVADVVVGTDNSGLSRSNTDLRNQTASASASETLPSNVAAEYSATFTESGVTEIGLKDGSGNLLCRAIVDSPIDLSSDTVSITVTFDTDPDVSRAVVTTDGQITARDIFADNNPNLPDVYAWGSGTSNPTESDTALDTQEYTAALDQLSVQSASTGSEFDTVLSSDVNSPVQTVNNRVQSQQSAFVFEAETANGGGGAVSDSLASDGEAQSLFDSVHSITFTANIPYTIPESAVGAAFRFRNPNDPDSDGTFEGAIGEVLIDGTSFGTAFGNDFSDDYDWVQETNYSGGDISGNTDITINVQSSAPSGARTNMDLVVIYDTRFSYTFDNTVGTNGYLDGPQLYPDSVTRDFQKASSPVNTTEARISSTWKDADVSGDQALFLSPDGNTFTQKDNTQTATFSFGSNTQELFPRFRFDRYGSRTTATPKTGFKGQAIESYDLLSLADFIRSDGIGEINARGTVEAADLTPPDTLTEAAQLDANGTALTRSLFADVEITANISSLISSETLTFRNP